MAETEVQKCLDWLLEQKSDLEAASFGNNKSSVQHESKQHSLLKSGLLRYKKDMDKLTVKHTLTDEEMQTLYGSYQGVQTLAEKRAGCFEVIAGIAELEDQIQGLSTEFDSRAVHLTNLTENNKQRNGLGLDNESMARTTQNCVTSVRLNWKWLDEVMQCAHVHLANAASYHEFFHEIDEVDYWMETTMSRMHLSFHDKNLKGDRNDINCIDGEMKDTLMAYLRWQSKVDSLFTRARDIVPVQKRTSPLKDPCPVVALTNYSGPEIEFTEGETLTLLDNSNKSKWRVQNSRQETGMVPAVIILIPGPSGEAVDAVVRLRIQLLGLWTTSVKRLGFQMISFMQLVFKDWNEDEIKAIQRMPKADRDDMLRILKKVDDTLSKNWHGYEGFEELQEKLSRLRTILEEAGDSNETDTTGQTGNVVFQVKMLENMLDQYQEFCTYWNTYKVVAELLKQPKYILVCDKWDQLKYQTTAHYVRFWDTNLQLTPGANVELSKDKPQKSEMSITLHETPKLQMSPIVEESMSSQAVQKTAAATDYMDRLKKDAIDGQIDRSEEYVSSSIDVLEHHRRQQLRTDEVRSSMEEVKHTFIIKTVTDPRTQKSISLHEAIRDGIIDNATNQYVNPITGKVLSLQQAMALGDIVVEFKSQQKVKEERSSYGIITVTSSTDSRPYTITAVVDPKTDKEISIETAYKKRILSPSADTYTTETGEKISIQDAIDSGLVKAEYQGEFRNGDTEETKVYAVNGVIDKKLKRRVSFHEALNKGLLLGEEGIYINNETNERMNITDAIMKGLIKARIVSDASKLDIDPESKIVVQKLKSVQEDVVKQVQVSKAFQAGIRKK